MRTEPQIIKAEKLTTVMVEAIMYGPTTFVERDGTPRFGGTVLCGTKTLAALIARGIVESYGWNGLTPKGIEIAKEIIADRKAVKAARMAQQETAPVEPTTTEAKPTVVAKDQAMRDEKLTGVMVYGIGAIGRRSISQVRSGTIVALIERGILTTATAETRGRHLLTDKGVKLYRLFNETEPELESIESYVTGHATVYTVGDKVSSVRRNNGFGAGVVTGVEAGQYGQVVYVRWADSSVPRPVPDDSLASFVEAEQVANTEQSYTSVYATAVEAERKTTEARAAAAGRESEATALGLNCEEVAQYVATGKFMPRYTARIVVRDESEEFMARHLEGEPLVNFGAAQMWTSIETARAHQKDRDKLARSIAYEFGHIFTPHGPEADRFKANPDRTRMVEFYTDGSINHPDGLIAEIENEMANIMLYGARGSRFERRENVRSMIWLGWLIGYIIESGTEGSDGWQDRRRGPQGGWGEMGLYSTEPSDETELPAWADIEDGDSFGCSATISPQGRYSDAETCGDGITRQEYYANGDESGMCEAHRLAEIVANDEPW